MILRGTDYVMAWIIPNTKDATRKRLDQYLVSIEALERQTGETFPEVPAFARSEKSEVSWLVPRGCH
jgi:endonuclease G, mitochondrial